MLTVVIVILLLLVLFGGFRGYSSRGRFAPGDLLWVLLFVLLVVWLISVI